MFDLLKQLDQLFFLFVNLKLANPVTDFIMPVITYGQGIVAIYLICLITMLWKGDRQLRWMVLFSIIILILCDQTASTLIKKWLCRPRPCHIMNGINLLVDCGGGWSMPSSHATNVFGQFIFFSFFYKRYAWILMCYAVLVAVSRVFVGVHYPGDILVGALVGSVIGLIMVPIFTWLKPLIIPGFKIEPPSQEMKLKEK